MVTIRKTVKTWFSRCFLQDHSKSDAPWFFLCNLKRSSTLGKIFSQIHLFIQHYNKSVKIFLFFSCLYKNVPVFTLRDAGHLQKAPPSCNLLYKVENQSIKWSWSKANFQIIIIIQISNSCEHWSPPYWPGLAPWCHVTETRPSIRIDTAAIYRYET